MLFQYSNEFYIIALITYELQTFNICEPRLSWT